MVVSIKIILKTLLVKHNVTAAQLSRATKVPPQTINNWLAGQSPRNLNQLKAVANYFKISMDSLIYGESKDMGLIQKYESEIRAGVFELILRKTDHGKDIDLIGSD